MRERIDIAEAVRLYEAAGNWRIVAQLMLRPNGTPYQPDSIRMAVRRHDRGLA